MFVIIRLKWFFKIFFINEGVIFLVIYVLLNWKENYLKNYIKFDFFKYFD